MKKLFFIALIYSLVGSSCSSDLVQPELINGDTASGSYANMLAIGDKLYLISEKDITTFDISDRSTPVELDKQDLNDALESLFYYEGSLFIGSRTELFIYSIAGSGIPEFQSRTSYGVFLPGSCSRDPVVVRNSIAYVTLSSVTVGECVRSELNELRLYDISNLMAPQLLSTTEMISPKGLGIDGNHLFVCEKDNGLKVFDVQDPLAVNLIHHFDGYEAFDVITGNGLLKVIGPKKLYQYDYSDISQMQLISTLDL